jgi:PleD family two-component response regulator
MRGELTMDIAAAHRARAEAERVKAAATNLPNRRVMYERAAEAWDVMALQIEETSARSIVNEAAKAAR